MKRNNHFNQNQSSTQNNNNNNNNNKNIYQNLYSSAIRNPQNISNNENNDDKKSNIDITKSKLNPEVNSFSQLDQGQYQLFCDIQNLNQQLISLKEYVDKIIQPGLQQVNSQLQLYTNHPFLLQQPENYLTYLQLTQQSQNLQQQYLDNQTMTFNVQKQLNELKGWYDKIRNEKAKPVLLLPDQEQNDENFDNNNNVINNDNNNNNDVIKNEQQDDNNETKEVSEPPSITSQVQTIQDSQTPLESIRSPSVSSNQYDDDNKDHESIDTETIDTETVDTETVDTETVASIENTQSDKDYKENYNDEEDEENDEEDYEEEEEDEYDEYDDEEPEIQKDVKDGKNEKQNIYAVKELISYQAKFLEINWTSTKYKDIPITARFVGRGVNNEKYMENVCAMFMRQNRNRWDARKGPKDKKTVLQKKLRGILNKMTPEKFDKIAVQTMDIFKVYAESKEMMDIIIENILQFAIKIPVFGDQYASLCYHLFENLPKLGMVCEFEWMLDPNCDLSNKFRQTVILQTNELFKEYKNHSPHDIHLDENGEKITDLEELEIKKSKRKGAFFAVMSLVAELFNVDLVHSTVIYKGLFRPLLPPNNKNLSPVDIEGCCRVLEKCGKKLDEQSTKSVNIYLQKLLSHSRKFDFRTKVLVENIKEMRQKRWTARLKKEKAKTKDEIREEFDAEQSQKRPHNNDQRQQRYAETYDDDDYNIGYNNNNNNQRNYSRSSSNLRQNRYSRSRSSYGSSYQELPSNRSNRSNRYSRYNDSQISNHSRSKPTIHDDQQKWKQKSSKKTNENESEENVPSVEKLNSYIDEYLASGVIDDILDYNCTDLRIWSSVINDSLRDRRSSQINDFIDLIVKLFDKNVLNNKGSNFINVVIKKICMELDDNCIDCPNFTKYTAILFVRLCFNEHLKAGSCYNYFVKRYKEYSEYNVKGQKKRINKVIDNSIDELENIQASQSLINKITKYRQ